jgi:hypothetical protein
VRPCEFHRVWFASEITLAGNPGDEVIGGLHAVAGLREFVAQMIRPLGPAIFLTIANEDRGVGMLAFRQVGEDFLLHRREARSAGDESLIARLQTLQRLVRRRCGIGNWGSYHGSRLCDHFNCGTERCRHQLSRMAALRRLRTTG